MMPVGSYIAATEPLANAVELIAGNRAVPDTKDVPVVIISGFGWTATCCRPLSPR